MSEHEIRFTLNGHDRHALVAARMRLLDVLRDEAGLSSLHGGCDQGACGSCTVLLDGAPVRSCLVLAPQIDGCSVSTLEAIRDTPIAAELREAFAAQHALQCGFCTPGLFVGAYALLASGAPVSRDDISALVEGHLCRCTGYAPVTGALQQVARNDRSPASPRVDRGRREPSTRPEIESLMNGDTRFISEIRRPGMLQATVLRSPHAAATFRIVDVEAARAMPGVVAILTGDDLKDVPPLPQVMPHPTLTSRTPNALAHGRVLYAGEPVCLVVATSVAAAEDARDRVVIEWREEASALDTETAGAGDAPRVHDDCQTNIAARFGQTIGDADAAFCESSCIVRGRFRLARLAAQALEPRAMIAEYAGGRLTVWLSSQSPHSARKVLSHQTGLPLDRIRVIASRAGGGFGFKNRYYPEYTAIAHAAIRLRTPVRWVEGRTESFTASYHAGEQVHDASLAVSADGRIRAVRDEFVYDQGAYTPLGVVVPWITSVSIPGPYRVPAYDVRGLAVFTNKTPASFYRGAGKPQATFVMERLLDLAADRLNLDRLEIRRRNLLTPAEFPHHTGLSDVDDQPIVYDSGDLPRCLQEVAARLEYDRFAGEQACARAAGRHIGFGVACYMEKSGLGPFEGATVEIDRDGEVRVASGISTQGQGHEQMLAQLCAERLCVAAERVRVTLGDTDAIAQGIGTYCARGAVMAGNAVAKAADLVRGRVLSAAANMLDLPATTLVLDPRGLAERGGRVVATLRDVASHVAEHPSRFGPDGELDQGLRATAFFRSEKPVFASGAYGVVVEVDPETGEVHIVRHCLVHDCGIALNPTAVEQQMTGGLLYGIGRALTEHFMYDDEGRAATESYSSYTLPRASDIPAPILARVETPSPLNPLGVKGVGEAGAIPVGAAVAAAVEHALAGAVHPCSLPIAPNRVAVPREVEPPVHAASTGG